MTCQQRDPWINGRACMRTGIQKHPYGSPDPKAGCPCERNLALQKLVCSFLAFRDCLSQGCSPIKYRELRLTLNLKEHGIYSPLKVTPYPFYLHLHLILPHLIHINIGKLCRFAKFRFEVKDWTLLLKRIRP